MRYIEYNYYPKGKNSGYVTHMVLSIDNSTIKALNIEDTYINNSINDDLI